LLEFIAACLAPFHHSTPFFLFTSSIVLPRAKSLREGKKGVNGSPDAFERIEPLCTPFAGNQVVEGNVKSNKQGFSAIFGFFC
jgi:hypothetical protein